MARRDALERGGDPRAVGSGGDPWTCQPTPPMVSAATSRRPLMAGLSPRSTLRMETLSQVPNSTKARMAQALDRPRGRTLRDWGTRRAGGRFQRCTDRHRHLPDEVLGSRCPVAGTEPRCMFAREAAELNDSRAHTEPVAQSRLT